MPETLQVSSRSAALLRTLAPTGCRNRGLEGPGATYGSPESTRLEARNVRKGLSMHPMITSPQLLDAQLGNRTSQSQRRRLAPRRRIDGEDNLAHQQTPPKSPSRTGTPFSESFRDCRWFGLFPTVMSKRWATSTGVTREGVDQLPSSRHNRPSPPIFKFLEVWLGLVS